jgi:hypothetical protein
MPPLESCPAAPASRTWVGICEQRANGQQHFGDGERRTPLIFQDVEADLAVAVDVAVVDAGAEGDLQPGGTANSRVLPTAGCTAG